MGKNVKIIVMAGLVILVVALTIGYSALSEKLSVTSSGMVTESNWGITFLSGTCNASGKATAGTVTLSPTSGNKLTATISGVVLKLPGDSVTCTIPVNNPDGSLDAVLTSFTSTKVVSPTFDGVSIDVKYDGASAVTDGSVASFSVNQKNMAIGTTKNLVVTFDFASSATAVPSQDINLSAGATLIYGQA